MFPASVFAQEEATPPTVTSLPDSAPAYNNDGQNEVDPPLDVPAAHMVYSINDDDMEGDDREITDDDYIDGEYEEGDIILDEEDGEYADELDSSLELVPSSEEARLPNPEYVIQTIRVTGNTQTSRERIIKMLGLDDTDRITLDELEDARFRLAMCGLFNSVDMSLRPGNERGSIVIHLHVSERSHLQFNNYTIGSSYKSPFWLGLDVTYLAPFATDHRFRMAFWATSSNDYTLSMNYLIPTIAHQPVSLMFSIQSLHSHEGVFGPSYYNNEIKTSENKTNPFEYLDDLVFERHGASIGLGYAPHPLVRLMFRVEYMNLLRRNDLSTVRTELDDFMKAGHGNLTTIEANVMYDSRAGRILPNKGHFIMLGLKGTARTSASDYSYFRMHLAHQSNFNADVHHVIRLQSFWGATWGNAPFFEKFFYRDFYTLAPSRFFMLNPSHRGAYDLFKTGASGLSYEDFIAHIALTYAWQPVARMLEIFLSVGATWADSLESRSLFLGTQPQQIRDSFAADMSFNAGIRFKTDYGLFSITLSNLLDLVVR